MKIPLILTSTMAMACSLPSCTNSSHLLLYQNSNLGLNAGVNPANQNVHARVGIRREFGAIVPKWKAGERVIPKVDKDGNPTDEAPEKVSDFQAASAYFGSRFRVSSIWQVPEVAEILTTGEAAVLAASGGKLKLADNSNQPLVPVTPVTPVTPVVPVTPPTGEDGDVTTETTTVTSE